MNLTPPPMSRLSRSSFGSSRSTATDVVAMPLPGQEFCGFRLMEELGHGTFARVYLARQEALAGRQVAVKVTQRPTREPERLARLQHTNVVPVYSVHKAAALQVICMPFLGRRTLADALSGYRKSPAALPGHSTRKVLATRKGSSVNGKSGHRIPAQHDPSAKTELIMSPDATLRVGDVAAILPILLQLADGLAHAHDRGVLHLDLKPANVLLADSGEPMLLDFNLSYADCEGKREVVGGTIPYMAPEQLVDLKTRGKGRVDDRTDLYSLGAMAFELLTGKHPFPVTSRTLTEFDGLLATRMKGPPSLRELNPDVSPAVDAIVRKLLAPKPEDRYQSARDLHEDLDRQLTDRPLRFASDRSPAERFGKWRRRNPHMLVAMLVAAVLAVAGGAGAYAFNESEKRGASEAEGRARATRDGLEAVRLDLTLPGDAAARTRGMKKTMSLLGEFGLPHDPNWQSRSTFQRVPPERRAALAGDVGELLLLLAQARWEEGKATDRNGAAADCLLLNELARNCFGDAPPPMLKRQRAELDSAIAGRAVEVQAGDSATARDYFLDAVRLFAASKFDRAMAPLETAIAGEPNHAAAQFLLARCKQHMGQYDAAVERYKSAAVLMPGDARPFYFMGISQGLLGLHNKAEEAFAAAIDLDKHFGAAYVGRGFARLEQREYRDAERDFTAAFECGGPKLQALHLRSVARRHLYDEAGAEADHAAAEKLSPERDADYIARGYSRMGTAPREALEDFRLALEKNPASIAARRNQIHVLSDLLGDEEGALKAATAFVEVYPEHANARVARALSLARLGKRDEALVEIEACRKILHEKGRSYRDPCLIYRIAMVYSLSSEKEPKDRAEAVRHLKEAFRTGFGDFTAVDQDRKRDLAAIGDLPEFHDAVEAAKKLAN